MALFSMTGARVMEDGKWVGVGMDGGVVGQLGVFMAPRYRSEGMDLAKNVIP